MSKTLRERLIEQGVITPKPVAVPKASPPATPLEPRPPAQDVPVRATRSTTQPLDYRKFRGPHDPLPIRDEATIKKLKQDFRALTDQLTALMASKSCQHRTRCGQLIAEIQRHQYHLSAQIPIVSNDQTMIQTLRRISDEIGSRLTPKSQKAPLIAASRTPPTVTESRRAKKIAMVQPRSDKASGNSPLKNLKRQRRHWLAMVERNNRGEAICYPNGEKMIAQPGVSLRQQLHHALSNNQRSIQIATRNAHINAAEIARVTKPRHSTLSPVGYGIQNSDFRRFSR